MPNPYHYRAHIDRLTRLTEASNPGYIRLRAVIKLLRELSPANPRSAANNRLLHSVDAYDFARHKLRDLYDNALPPLPLGEGSGEGPLALTEDDPSEEDDDPL